MDSDQPDQLALYSELYQMAYCSVLKQPLTKSKATALLEAAQVRNAQDDITGLLMMDSGLVIQWIEGPRPAVRALWARLLVDPRHHCIVELLHREFQTERLFPDWSMRHANRQEMLSIVHNARELAATPNALPSPWAGALSTLCLLLDPVYAATYAALHKLSPDVQH